MITVRRQAEHRIRLTGLQSMNLKAVVAAAFFTVINFELHVICHANFKIPLTLIISFVKTDL